MPSAGAALLRRPAWTSIQGGSLARCWKLGWGLLTEHLSSPPHGLSVLLGLLTGFQEVSLHNITSTTFCYQNSSESTQFKEKGKRLSLHEPSRYSNPSYLWRKNKPEFYCWGLIPLLSIKNRPPVDSVPTGTRGTDSLLLDLLQGKSENFSDYLGWNLTSRGSRAPWGYLKDQGVM